LSTVSRLTIALDAMGGDNAPQVVVRGANIARQRNPQVEFLLFGRESEIAPLLSGMQRLRDVARIVHTDDVVRSDEKPSVALRSGRNSSMRLAINAVQEGAADGVVSAGNTGALMAMSKFVLKTLPGIDRPAIASFFPTLKGESVMLDLGANIFCDAKNLVDFAVLGTSFARTVLGQPEPSYGLLNVGSEEIKGHEALHEASAILREARFPGHFVGFVEGDDIAKGTVDVIVTDGFTGNVALKTAEGTAKRIRAPHLQVLPAGRHRLSPGASGHEQAAPAGRSPALQRRRPHRPQRGRGEESRRHRHNRLRPRHRRGHRSPEARLHRRDPQGLREHAAPF
jgi:glycerol-3-phosphate acyltransferase PlsX